MNGNKRIIRTVIFLYLLLFLSGCVRAAENNFVGIGMPAAKSNCFFTVPGLAAELTAHPLSEVDRRRPKEEFVMVNKYIPDIFVDLKYSTADNFTGKDVYDF